MCGNLGTYRGLEREKKMLTEDMFYNFGEDEMEERLMSTDGRKQMRMSSRNATRQAAQLCRSPDRPMSQHSRK